MRELTTEEKAVMRKVRVGGAWTEMGHRRHTPHGEGRAPDAILRRLLALGLVDVRTVTRSPWVAQEQPWPTHSRPAVVVEARLTETGIGAYHRGAFRT